MNVPDEELTKLDILPVSWAQFQASLDEAHQMLERAKDGFREKLTKMVDAQAKDASMAREAFTAGAPFSNEVFLSSDHWSILIYQRCMSSQLMATCSLAR